MRRPAMVLTALACLALVACAPAEPTPTVTVTEWATVTETVTVTPTPTEAPEPTPEPTPAPDAAPAPVWERYGPSTSLDLGEDYWLTLAPAICSDVQTGNLDVGFLHGFLTGGPDKIKPQAGNVRQAVSVIEAGCPEDYDTFVTMLDAYDAEHGPY